MIRNQDGKPMEAWGDPLSRYPDEALWPDERAVVQRDDAVTVEQIAALLREHQWKRFERNGQIAVCKAGCKIETGQSSDVLASRIEAAHQAAVIVAALTKNVAAARAVLAELGEQ